jgi:TolB-like protein
VTEASHAVFLSYASQDAEAARRLCDALRAAAIEVWFDQSELRGGDPWDRQIRKQIHDCILFVPIISKTTQARVEGYFRREWKLAVDRTHDLSDRVAFLIPIVIDETAEAEADVPEAFRAVQWTRLPAGETPPAFVHRISRLLSPGHANEHARPPLGAVTAPRPPSSNAAGSRQSKYVPVLIATGVLVAVSYFARERFMPPKPIADTSKAPAPVVQSVVPAQSTIPEKSIAVLPFVDMSEKHDQEYFSDGLAEELIDRLANATDLKVIARTSSFYFKGKQATIREIAQSLGVSHVLEGSVRKAGDTLRVTVQLIRVADGTHVWSQTYDRSLSDIFKVQDEISERVASALAVSLAATVRTLDSSSSAAYVLYLQGRARAETGGSEASAQSGLLDLEQVVKLEPTLAPAWASVSRFRLHLYIDYNVGTFQEVRETVLHAAQEAVRLEPELAEAHLALGRALMDLDWNWVGAEREIDTAIKLGPSNAHVFRNAFYLSSRLGRWEEGVRRAKSATVLDPLNYMNYRRLGDAYQAVRNYSDSEAALRTALRLAPEADYVRADLAETLLAEGKPEEALAELEREPSSLARAFNLPDILDALGRKRDSDDAVAAAVGAYGDSEPYLIATVYALRKDAANTFRWLNRAFQQRDRTLITIKSIPTDPRASWISVDPRYKAMLRKMNLPE